MIDGPPIGDPRRAARRTRRLKVIDAGVVVAVLIGDLDPISLRSGDLAAPHFIDSEVTNVLRRLVARGALDDDRASTAFEGFLGLQFQRYRADPLRPRMWELRHSLSGSDATYVALAEATGAAALVTTDARLAAAPGVQCPIELL